MTTGGWRWIDARWNNNWEATASMQETVGPYMVAMSPSDESLGKGRSRPAETPKETKAADSPMDAKDPAAAATAAPNTSERQDVNVLLKGITVEEGELWAKEIFEEADKKTTNVVEGELWAKEIFEAEAERKAAEVEIKEVLASAQPKVAPGPKRHLPQPLWSREKNLNKTL